MCLKDVLEEFILELEMQNYSPRTIKAYRNNNLLMFTFIEKEFDITELERIETVHILSFICLLYICIRVTSIKTRIETVHFTYININLHCKV